MKSEEIVRSWKDETYWPGLSDKVQALLPENPAGAIELTDVELNELDGGSLIAVCISFAPVCGTLITFCPSAITFCIPTLEFCPL